MKPWCLILIYITSILATAFVCSRLNTHDSICVENNNQDTFTVYKLDTIRVRDTVYSTNKIVDTIYIETGGKDTVYLPVIQKLFSKPSMYDIWISGVEPLTLDSANFYKQTEYKTITNYVDRPVQIEKLGFYAGGGLFALSGSLTPYMGVSIKTRQKWLIEANFGFNGYFGVSAKYKIF